MVVGLLAVAAIGITIFSFHQMMQEKVIKFYDMREYGYPTNAPPLEEQTSVVAKISEVDLRRMPKYVKHEKVEVRYFDLSSSSVVGAKSGGSYYSYEVKQGSSEVKQGSSEVRRGSSKVKRGSVSNLISSLRGGQASASYDYKFYTRYLSVPISATVNVDVPKKVTFMRSGDVARRADVRKIGLLLREHLHIGLMGR